MRGGRRPSGRLLVVPLRWLGVLVRGVAAPPARALRGTARLVADPAHQVVDYWSSERATIKQAFVAICISGATSIVAGLVLAGMHGRLDAIAGLFVLIPVSIGMRGNIFGALAARLGTSIQLGLFESSLTRTGVLGQNTYGATLLTLGTSVAMGLLARSMAGLLGIQTMSVWDYVVVALVGGLLSSAVVLAFTVLLSVQSFKRGWDLDSVGAVLITAIGDLVTLPCLLAASFLVALHWVTPVLGILFLLSGVLALYRGYTTALQIARRIVRESFPILCLAIVLDVLAGTVVEPRVSTLFVAFPAFLIFLPGFLENTGALGSILAARLGTKLHLGAATPTARPGAAAILDATIVAGLGVITYSLIALASLVAAALFGMRYPGLLTFLGVALIGGLLALLVATLIGYYAAILTYRFGFDPDNHTIPLVTSGMDLLGVICLVTALVIFGVA